MRRYSDEIEDRLRTLDSWVAHFDTMSLEDRIANYRALIAETDEICSMIDQFEVKKKGCADGVY